MRPPLFPCENSDLRTATQKAARPILVLCSLYWIFFAPVSTNLSTPQVSRIGKIVAGEAVRATAAGRWVFAVAGERRENIEPGYGVSMRDVLQKAGADVALPCSISPSIGSDQCVKPALLVPRNVAHQLKQATLESSGSAAMEGWGPRIDRVVSLAIRMKARAATVW